VPIEREILSSLASEYVKDMTSIRGRRVQRQLKRVFAGSEYVLLAQLDCGIGAVLGLSPSGTAICVTDGKGKHASVVKWSHGSGAAHDAQFDLHKDSLPVLRTKAVPLTRLGLHVAEGSVPPQARSLLSKVLQVLA